MGAIAPMEWAHMTPVTPCGVDAYAVVAAAYEDDYGCPVAGYRRQQYIISSLRFQRTCAIVGRHYRAFYRPP